MKKWGYDNIIVKGFCYNFHMKTTQRDKVGIVESQGTKHSLIQYFGVLISAFSTLFIYPLDTELYGLLAIFNKHVIPAIFIF